MSLGEKLVELIKQAEQEIRNNFPTQFGRYHNVSDTLFIEVFGEADKITWRSGEIELNTSKEETMETDPAIIRLITAMRNGYAPVIKAKTEVELLEKKKQLTATYSLIKQSGKLGTYIKGDYWIRIKEYMPKIYSIETGYRTMMENIEEKSESETLLILDQLEREGYIKEGTSPIKESSTGTFDFSIFKKK